MSLLSVSSISNPSAPQVNISLNADGSVTLPVFTGSAAPPLVQAGTLWFNTTGPALQIRNPANTAWLPVGGGGSGTVTNVTGTAPIVVATGSSTPAISITAATTAAPGSIQLATQVENAAGTDATKAVTPAFSVPKDASGMTGAGILPSGTTAQRPATPVSGMVRVNTDTAPQLEQYAGGAWQPIGVITSNLTLNVATTGNDTTGLGTVAAPWATPQRAMAYLSNYQIAQGVTVTVAVADGTYTFTTPLNLNHPNGSQIFINGGTTTGSRPTTTLTGGNAVGNTGATLAANDTLLNAYYNTKWQFNGCNGLVCSTGGGVTVNTVLIRGNAVSPWVGVLAGNFSASANFASSGSINLGNTVAIHNFGSTGLSSSFGGSIIADGITVTNSGFAGILTNAGGQVSASGGVCNNSSGPGVSTSFGGTIIFGSGTSRYNTGNGIVTSAGGSISADGATMSNNGSNGIITSFGGSISANSATASNNGGNGILTSYGGSINATGATASNNGSTGVSNFFGGSINIGSGTVTLNGLDGVASYSGGPIAAQSVTSSNNVRYGIFVDNGGYTNAATATALSNGSTNVSAIGWGGIYFTGGNAAGSLSPAANTIGNGNAYILV